MTDPEEGSPDTASMTWDFVALNYEKQMCRRTATHCVAFCYSSWYRLRQRERALPILGRADNGKHGAFQSCPRQRALTRVSWSVRLRTELN